MPEDDDAAAHQDSTTNSGLTVGPEPAQAATSSAELPDTAMVPTSAPSASADPSATGEVSALRARIAELEAALASSTSADPGDTEMVELDDQKVLQDVGIYRYHHPLEDAAAYKGRLKDLEGQIDQIVKAGEAVLAADMFTFAGSLAKGRRMVADLSKLMLRAYNAEADNCVRSLRAGNISTAKKRLEKSVKAIEKLGVIMEMRINPDYHALRVAELELTADYQMKVQEERERAREERELLREQRRAEQELAAERERLEKERAHYVSVLESLRASAAFVDRRLEAAVALIEYGAAVDAPNMIIAPGGGGFGHTALHTLTTSGDVPGVMRLIAAGADVNRQTTLGWTPLHFAVQKDNSEMVLTLLRSGADPDIGDLDGERPVVFAGRETRPLLS